MKTRGFGRYKLLSFDQIKICPWLYRPSRRNRTICCYPHLLPANLQKLPRHFASWLWTDVDVARLDRFGSNDNQKTRLKTTTTSGNIWSKCHMVLLRSRENMWQMTSELVSLISWSVKCSYAYVSILHCFQGTYWLFQAPITLCNVFWNHLRTENRQHTTQVVCWQSRHKRHNGHNTNLDFEDWYRPIDHLRTKVLGRDTIVKTNTFKYNGSLPKHLWNDRVIS